MLAASTPELVFEPAAPVALVVTSDTGSRARACRALQHHGYGVVTVEDAETASAVISLLEPDVVLLDARRALTAVTRVLFQLSRLTSPPRTLLFTEKGERWVGARFGVGTTSGRSLRELGRALARSIQEDSRPTLPR